MIHITFLGTSSMVPTKERNHSAVLLKYETEGILVDCGEGTQRQLKIAGISPNVITKILLTHWHGDHVLGLPGLLQTLGMSDYTKTLEIYGPKGTKQRIKALYKAFAFEASIKLDVKEIKKGIFYECNAFKLQTEQLQHGIECLGYAFIEKDKRKVEMQKAKQLGLREGPMIGKLQEGKPVMLNGKRIMPDQVSSIEPGKKISFILDTAPCNGAKKIAKDADILISEATYANKLEEKGEAYGHMTSQQAASIASQANVKKLVLTHFSQRYKDVDELLQEAKQIFEETICAYDLMKLNI